MSAFLYGSDAQIFYEPQFRFVDDFFQTAEAGKRKPIDRNRADFADRRFFQRRTTAFFVDQKLTSAPSHKPLHGFKVQMLPGQEF